MTFKPRNSFIIKMLLGVLFIGAIVYFLPNSNAEKQSSEENYQSLEVPHSFTPNATGLVNNEQEVKGDFESRLNKYDIRKALYNSLECSELKVEEHVTLTIDDMMIPITAYNRESKIGFIWLDYPLFGEGIIDKTLTKYKSQEKAEQVFLNRVENGIELFLDNEEKFILDIFGEDPATIEEIEEGEEVIDIFPDFSNVNFKDHDEFLKYVRERNIRLPRFRVDPSANSTRRNWTFFKEAYDEIDMLYQFGQEIESGISNLHKYEDRREYLELMFCGFKKKIFLEELNSKSYKTFIDDWIFSAAEKIEDPIRFFGFVERIKYLGYPTIPNELSKAIDKEILKISNTSNTKKWWEHSQALVDLLQANKIPVINAKPEYNELLERIITNNSYNKWQDHFDEINDLSNKFTISKKELMALPGLSASHGISLATISILDDRMIYDMEDKEHQDKMSELRKKIAQSKESKERKALQDDLLALSQFRSTNYPEIRDNAKAKSMNVIIDDIEVFLDWAKDISEKWGNTGKKHS